MGAMATGRPSLWEGGEGRMPDVRLKPRGGRGRREKRAHLYQNGKKLCK